MIIKQLQSKCRLYIVFPKRVKIGIQVFMGWQALIILTFILSSVFIFGFLFKKYCIVFNNSIEDSRLEKQHIKYILQKCTDEGYLLHLQSRFYTAILILRILYEDNISTKTVYLSLHNPVYLEIGSRVIKLNIKQMNCTTQKKLFTF